MDELARIAVLARVLGAGGVPAPGVDVGIGDDAAVLDAAARFAGGAGRRCVWTIDQQVEGTHFRRELVSFRDVGWRSFMAAASDVAAMGAEPWCALSALVLADDVDDDALEGLGLGQAAAAAVVGAPVVGGNLARGRELSVATTLLGVCDRAVARSGARAGDGVWLSGDVGLAAAGLRALLAGREGDSRLDPAIAAWRRPHARIAQGRAMSRVATAAIDVSDGLARDAGHVAEASGVQIAFDAAALGEGDVLASAASALGVDPCDLALYGGEDYALVVTSAQPIDGFRRIGEVRAGRGLVLRAADGERAIDPRGFDHFSH